LTPPSSKKQSDRPSPSRLEDEEEEKEAKRRWLEKHPSEELTTALESATATIARKFKVSAVALTGFAEGAGLALDAVATDLISPSALVAFEPRHCHSLDALQVKIWRKREGIGIIRVVIYCLHQLAIFSLSGRRR
jgi:dienelactone hydrolase